MADKIKKLVDLYVEKSKAAGLLNSPVVPDDMVDGNTDEEGWTPWKPIPSSISNTEITKLENKIRTPLPALFKEYLTYLHILEFDVGWIRLMALPSDRGIREVEHWIFNSHMSDICLENGYVIIGEDGNNAGYLCFDTNSPIRKGLREDIDYPIVLVTHGTKSIVILEEIARSFEDLVEKILNKLTE